MNAKDATNDTEGRGNRAEGSMTVVGIVASAGGLEAVSLFAQHLPADLNCVYVLAQHMSPHHASVLPALLSRETRLAVKAVESEEILTPGTLFVPVPKTDLVVKGDRVMVKEPSGRTGEPKPSADRLLTSIAEEYGERSMGIVLSGTGSDGSYGVQAIREAGGITIAQDSESSKYDTMPASAVETGCIDLVLSPRQMGEQLVNILSRPRDFAALQEALDQPTEYDDLFHQLQARTKVNFRHYKENTVSRRIQRRLIALGFEEYARYVEFCRDHPEELDALYRDLLISVTRFYRDPDQFRALDNALAEYVEGMENRPFRIWVPGCATGEEAYTIAFIVNELLETRRLTRGRTVQIFATDLDEAALMRGRNGAYPAAASAGIPEKIQQKYFTLSDDVLRVKPEIRNQVLFSRHNVFQDPPFSDIDLVSFRNTMIYFDAPLQEKVMARLLYALRPGGLLFVGASESIGTMEPYFSRVGEGARLFRKRVDTAFDHKALVRFGNSKIGDGPRARADRKAKASSEVLETETFKALAESVAPQGVLVNVHKDIIRIFGDISPFTRITDDMRGRLNTMVLKAELAADASSLIPLCLKHGRPRDGLWRDIKGPDFNRVRLRAYPLNIDPGNHGRLALLSIDTTMVDSSTEIDRGNEEASSYLTHVENELADSREALQITMEELQTSNEELQSTNEELQSTNEELQSTNEELETSNEELQSTNEELITVNEELLINSDELNRLVAEKNAIQVALPLPLLVLDTSLNIKSASHNAIELFALSERGSHLGHISQVFLPNTPFPALVDICHDVLTRQKSRSEIIELNGERTEMRITPYFIKEKILQGLTITLQRAP